jgi:hypothetical protein
VAAAELVPGAARQLLDGVALGHVGNQAQPAPAARAHLFRHRLDGSGLHVGDHHVHALVGQGQSQGAADPAGRAGDHRNAVPELLHAS